MWMPLRLLILLQLSLLFGLPGGAQVALRQVCDFGCEYSSFAAALSVSSAGDEIQVLRETLSGEPSVNITFPLTISAVSPVHVSITETEEEDTAWLTVSSNLHLYGNFTIHAAALHIVGGGRVVQKDTLTIFPPLGMGVRIEQGGTFLQQGALVIGAPNNQTIGMFCKGEWQQLGSFQANSSGHQSPCLETDVGCLGSVSALVFRGRWTQNGTVEISATHVAVAVMLAEWIQNAPVTLSVIADEPPASPIASVQIANAFWRQNAALQVVASQRSAIYLGDLAPGYSGSANLWQQDGRVELRVRSPLAGNQVDYPYVGVEFNGTNILWNQNADVEIILETPATTNAFNCKAQPSWNVQKGNLSISPAAEISLDKCVRTLPFVSNASAVTDSEQPALRFDTTNTALQIVPKAVSEQEPDQFVEVEEATVGLGFASIAEVADNGTYLQTGNIVFGSWSVLPSNSLGASQAFVFKAVVIVDDQTLAVLRPPCTVEMEVFLFDEATNVTIGDLASFTVLPELTKIALRVSSWPWLDAGDNSSSRLEVRLAVSPSFTNVTYPSPPPPVVEEPVATRRQEASSSELTSLLLSGQRSSDGKRALTTEVRFVSVVELDGIVQAPSGGGGRAPVEFDADVESSSLVMSFGYFAANMSYDPDLGVLVGRRDGSSGTSDDNTWVIAVSIAVPLAVVAVVGVIAVGLMALAQRKRRRTKQLKKMLSATRADNLL